MCRNVAPGIDKEGTHTNARKEKEKKRRLVYFYGKPEDKTRKVKGGEDAYWAKPWMDGIFLADSAHFCSVQESNGGMFSVYDR